MKLHSHEVNRGDKVYDLVEGQGVVVRLSKTTSFKVRFSSQRSYDYNSEGKRLGNVPARYPALLYWQNPIAMIPAKDDEVWLKLCDVFKHAHKQMS